MTEGIHAVVSRGPSAGLILQPYVQDGFHIVSHTNRQRDYVRVAVHEPLAPWLAQGFRLRMSAPGWAPSLIAASSIKGWR